MGRVKRRGNSRTALVILVAKITGDEMLEGSHVFAGVPLITEPIDPW